jgi:hypothetical protein
MPAHICPRTILIELQYRTRISISRTLAMDWLLGGPQLQNTVSQIGVQVGNTYRIQDTCLGEFKPIFDYISKIVSIN